MSYSPDFLYDVFISYASADDEPDQLISYFADRLKKNLAGQGIRDGLSIFLDKTRLESGSSLTNQILAGAESTAVMVAFHSPAYDASEDWCHREYREFVDRNGLKLKGRFFLIALDGGKLPSKSPVFTGADRRFRSFFTEKNGKTLRFAPNRADYKNTEDLTLDEEIQFLATEIAKTLEGLRSASAKKRVFLTSTHAFENHAKDLQTTLTDRGFVVLRSSPWLEKEQRLSAAATGIERADLVISIMEQFRSVAQTEPAIHAAEQAEITTRLQKPALKWLPSTNHGFSETEIAQLKTQPEIIATSLEEFKTVMLARLTGPAPAPAGVPPPVSSPAGPAAPFPLFLSASQDAEGALANVLKRTKDLNINYYEGRVDTSLSNDDATIETWCRQIKESIANFGYTAVVFIDGLCPAAWIDTRLRNYLVLERDLPTTPKKAVYDCPPIPKGDMRMFRPPRVTFLPCDDDKALREFLLR